MDKTIEGYRKKIIVNCFWNVSSKYSLVWKTIYNDKNLKIFNTIWTLMGFASMIELDCYGKKCFGEPSYINWVP